MLYDALVSPAILALAAHARCLSVGKRHGRHSVSQDTINRLPGARRQAQAARRPPEGRRPVRLRPRRRGGSGARRRGPPLRGRPRRVVGDRRARRWPASRSPTAAWRPACWSSPGTPNPRGRPAVESLAPKGTTLVVLMGVNTRAQIAGRLVARGWTGHDARSRSSSRRRRPTPRTWIGTLGDLVAGAPLQSARRARAPWSSATSCRSRRPWRRPRRASLTSPTPPTRSPRQQATSNSTSEHEFHGSHRRSEDPRPIPPLLRHGG